jgi:hypothetical protein
MVVIEFKIPHGLKTKARRDGYSLVKYSNQPFYHLRKKNSPKIGKNHHKFGNTMQELKISYRKLNDAEKQALKERRKKEGSTKSDWIQFVREYYRGISRQALKEKRQVKAQNKKDQVNKPQNGSESKNLREKHFIFVRSPLPRAEELRSQTRMTGVAHGVATSDNLYSSEVPCLELRKSGLKQFSDFRLTSLSSDNFPFVFDICCSTGNFEATGSSWEWTKKQLGTVGFVGHSVASYTLINNRFYIGITDELWNQSNENYLNHIGLQIYEAQRYSHQVTGSSEEYLGPPFQVHNYFSNNIMSDPSYVIDYPSNDANLNYV